MGGWAPLAPTQRAAPRPADGRPHRWPLPHVGYTPVSTAADRNRGNVDKANATPGHVRRDKLSPKEAWPWPWPGARRLPLDEPTPLGGGRRRGEGSGEGAARECPRRPTRNRRVSARRSTRPSPPQSRRPPRSTPPAPRQRARQAPCIQQRGPVRGRRRQDQRSVTYGRRPGQKAAGPTQGLPRAPHLPARLPARRL